MLVEGEDVKFAAKTKSSQDHIVNVLPVVFVLCYNEKKIALLSIMKFSRLSFKDTMMLGVLNFVEYLQTIVLSKPEKFSFLSFSTLSGLSSPTYSFSRTHAPNKIFWGVLHLSQCLKKLPIGNITYFEIFHCLDKKGLICKSLSSFG